MLIFNEHNQTILLDNIYTPTATEHFWVLDLQLQDFAVEPLLVLEETICPTLELCVAGFKFNVPSTWHMLVIDEDTSQLDVSEVSNLAGKNFTTLVYGPESYRPRVEQVTVTNYFPNAVNVGPSLNKNQMLCHPINEYDWVNIAPSDTYNKFLKKMLMGDII